MSGYKFGPKSGRMKAAKFPRYLISACLFIFFLLPYILFLPFFKWQIHVDLPEILWAAKNSLIQAGSAAALCVVVGSFLSFGVFQLSEVNQKIISKILLLPFILPVFFSILISFSVLRPFPMGHAGVIFIFTLINLGFTVYQITFAIRQKLGSFAAVSELYGISKFKFFRKILVPLISADLKLNFILIFLFCISSLAVPLVAGGGKSSNLEVLIYEKIFIDQNWDTAWLLILIQSTGVFLLSYFCLRNNSFSVKAFNSHGFIKSKLALFGLAIYLVTYIGGYTWNLIQAFSAASKLLEFQNEIIQSTLNTFLIVICTLILTVLILLLWIFDYAQNLRPNFVTHLISVSTILVGFAFYLTFPQAKLFDYLKMPLAFSIIFLPLLFKMFLEKNVESLKTQIIVAKIHSISYPKIILEILFPQLRKPLAVGFSFLFICLISDFAISKSLGTQTLTLGLMAQSFLMSYRLELAFLLSFYMLFIWFAFSAAAYFFLKDTNGTN